MGHCPAAFSPLGDGRDGPLISGSVKKQWAVWSGIRLSPSHISLFPLDSLGLFHAFILFSLSVSLTATGFTLSYPSIVAGRSIFFIDFLPLQRSAVSTRHQEHAGVTKSQIKVAPQRVSVRLPVGGGRGGLALRGPSRPYTS